MPTTSRPIAATTINPAVSRARRDIRTSAGAARSRRRGSCGSAAARAGPASCAGRRCRSRAAARHLAGVLVQLQVLELEPAGLVLRRPRAAQDVPNPRDQLLEAERLGHVVVAATGQAAQLVLARIAG